MSDTAWPALPLDAWKETYATLHLWSQIVGKVALAQTPPVNHSWGVALHLTPRGLSTLLLPHGRRSFTLEFDFIDHQLVARTSDGDVRTIALEPQSVADFYGRVMSLLGDMSLPVRIWPVAVESPAPIRLDEDMQHMLPYEAVRAATSPEQAIRDFVDSTYEAAVTLARWDRRAVERGR